MQLCNISAQCIAEQSASYRTKFLKCRVIAQAVSRRLPTAAARVRARVRSCGSCGGQSGTGAGFLRVLRFPLPIRIPPIAPQSSSSIIRGGYNRPNSGRSTKWTQFHPMRKKVYEVSVASANLLTVANLVYGLVKRVGILSPQ
jgi:hypothetical protein